MSHITDLQDKLEEYQTAEVTAAALEDIGAIAIQNIRSGFDKNRAFFDEIRTLYGTVRAQHHPKNTEQAQAPRQERLYIAITSNKRFYGTLTRDIVDRLIRELGAAPNAQAIIVGRIGWQYFEQLKGPRAARQLTFADDTPTAEEFESLIKFFEGYDRVFVLYPKFINSFRQQAAMEDITHASDVLESQSAALPPSDDSPSNLALSVVALQNQAVPTPEPQMYIFEPEIGAILQFFDTQVRRALLDRILLEASLSRTATRLVKMEEAVNRARELIAATDRKLRRAQASLSNEQLLETYAGITQFKQSI